MHAVLYVDVVNPHRERGTDPCKRFRTIRRGTGQLSESPLPQANAYAILAGLSGAPIQVRSRSSNTTAA
jgi:hypothetical protein